MASKATNTKGVQLKQRQGSTPNVAPKAGVLPAKGVTKDGKPRQRAYRTYYGLTLANLMVRYPSYEAREKAVLEEGVKRLTAHEVRARETLGERAMLPAAALAVSPSPVSSGLNRVDSERGVSNTPSSIGRDPAHESSAQQIDRIDARTLVEAQIMLDQSLTALATIQRKLNQLSGKG